MADILNKLVLQGKAEQKTLSCFGAQYFALDIPFQQTIVITNIIWTPFINFPYVESRTTLNEIMNYLNYQLKIADDKSSTFFHFNNSSCNIQPLNLVYDMTAEISKCLDTMIFQNGAQINIPCFLPIQNQLRMTITRCPIQNIQVEESVLINTSKEPILPDGIKDLLQSVYLRDFVSNALNYQPGIESPIPDFFIGNKYNGYYWGATNDGELTPVDNYPFELKSFTQPLFTIEYTLIKENLIGLID